MTLVALKDVEVVYPLYDVRDISLKGSLLRAVGGRLGAAGGHATVQSLKGISFVLREGDRLGVLGHNGAGKTTLLKVCAGILEPTSGEAHLEGNVASFTDITMGMDPEETGYENIIRRAIFMGFSLKEARELIPKVEEFSELGDYLHLPIRTYSTGMFLRLAFAVSTAITPDILIMDELISAGDASFIDKAKRRMDEMLADANIIVLASHDMELLRQVCNKGLLLQEGEPRFFGPIDEAIGTYQEGLASSC